MSELSDRQVVVIKHVGDNPGGDAKSIHEALVAAGQDSKDARGAAQTARRLPQYIARDEKGAYTLTSVGRKKHAEL